MDFLQRLKDFTEGLSYTPSTIEIGLFNEDSDSIAVRPSPSNINVRYMEKGKMYPFTFQLLIHYKNNLNAYLMAQDLMDEFEKLAVTSNDNSFALLDCKCTTTPNFVQETYYGTLWTAIFEAELYIAGR